MHMKYLCYLLILLLLARWLNWRSVFVFAVDVTVLFELWFLIFRCSLKQGLSDVKADKRLLL